MKENVKCQGFRILAFFLAAVLCVSPVHALDHAAPGDTPPEAYLALYPFGDVSAPLLEQSAPADSPLRGKSILFFGDSITSGYGLPDYSQSWPARLESVYGMKVTNISVGGSTFIKSNVYGYKTGGCYAPYVDRTLPDGSFDIVFVQGGGNDWCVSAPMGSGSETRDPYTFRGAVNVVFDRIQNKYPNALILSMTTWETRHSNINELNLPEDSYFDALTLLSNARGIPCFQARDPEISGIHVNDDSFRARYFLTPTDRWHLNAAGQALFLPVIAAWLESQLQVCGFEDVIRGSWYADAVEYVSARGLMVGVGNNRFAPDQNMTRAMLVTVLYRAAGSPSVAGMASPFSDVPKGAWYADAVTWAYHIGLTYGVDSTHFAPDKDLTREQMAAFFYRIAVPAQQQGHEDLSVLERFRDSDQIRDFGKHPLAWAVTNDILTGTGRNQMEPQSTATRAQLATVLQRFLNRFSPF